VRVVLIVLDAPRLKREDERHEHDGANDVFYQLILAEAAMSTVMPNHKHLQAKQPNSSRDVPLRMLLITLCNCYIRESIDGQTSYDILLR
jgi:hypothetical protein